MSILVVGSVALDTIITPTGKAEEVIGGSAVHFSAAASFFAPVRVVGVAGTDFPLENIEFLLERRVDLAGLEVVEGKTFRWIGEYQQDWNAAITHDTQLNVFETFSPKIPTAFRQTDYLFLANINPGLQLKVLEQIEKPKLTALDTMNFWIQGQREALLKVIEQVDLLFINDTEAKLLSGQSNMLDAASVIFEMGPQSLVIKKGEHGALLFHHNEIFALPAFPLTDIVDPTGAGDSFAGGFLGYVAKQDNLAQMTMRQAVVMGSVIASFTVTDFSCVRLQTLNQDDIERRYREFQELVRF